MADRREVGVIVKVSQDCNGEDYAFVRQKNSAVWVFGHSKYVSSGTLRPGATVEYMRYPDPKGGRDVAKDIVIRGDKE